MNQKIKILFGALGVVALVSVYQLYGSVSFTKYLTGNVGLLSQPLPTPDNDPDHDGLTNAQEAYWNTDPYNPDTDGDGFKDGEEVASGHDPTIPGPNDLLPQYQQNVTTRVGNLVLSGLFEGSLKQDSPNFDTSVNQIIDEILAQSQINLGTVDPNHFTVVSDTPDNERTYGKKVYPLLLDISKNDPKSLQSLLEAYKSVGDPTHVDHPLLVNFFSSQASALQNQIDQLSQVSVPQRWLAPHDRLVTFLKQIKKAYASLQNVQKDPFQSFVALSKLIDFLITDFTDVIKPFASLTQ